MFRKTRSYFKTIELTYMEKTEEQKGLFGDINKDLIATASIQTVKAFQKMASNNGEDNQTTSSPSADAALALVSYFYSAAAFGVSLFATSTIFYRFTGSIFNPSVSLALYLIGAIKPIRFILVSAAQMAGSLVAFAILTGPSPIELDVNVQFQNGTSRTKGVFIEAFSTAGLILSVLMLAVVPFKKHLFTPFAPMGFALTLFIIVLYSSPFTGGAVKAFQIITGSIVRTPAAVLFRAPLLIESDSLGLGPTLGSLLATGAYVFLKAVHYW
ncbi:hypothetical protein I204_02057 [Kwoniella mangroviensis CBS 8886]|nr:uncharacterized protein I203_03636 [Kwoniella mangroviensis CBS 8507]OCF66954.1 hypothetical protein I203_03636 [Kwoniella mangroviensis CBS 8507]OCF78051.1 hypothetical protein I204_02057 [Kwoniella mangroviensis CBS 8886]